MMERSFWLCAVLLQLLAIAREGDSNLRSAGYSYQVKYFTVTVDHFNPAETRSFQMRYLVNDTNWSKGGPVFFYTGNEGDIEWFCNNTGFMWDIAPQFGAALIFGEHRYYGKSLPFGTESYKDLEHIRFLTSEQALADYAELLTHLRETEFLDCPIIAFGGSYGGMLSAWFRMKYPNIAAGSIAASAPIWQFTGLTPCERPYQIVSEGFYNASKNCFSNIQRSWNAIERIASEAGGLEILTKTLRLCEPLNSSVDLMAWLASTWFNLAETNYPYPASFLEPLPAWPVTKTCEHLSENITDDYKLMEALASALQVYYNTSQTTKCFNTSGSATTRLGDAGWDFQACTEMVMPFCSDGIQDMFFPDPWNLNAYIEGCYDRYGVIPKPFWIETLYGGKNISSHSNIVFSNGLLDPWSGGGVLKSVSDTLVAVVIPNGAHHLDMRAANPDDPADLKAARSLERKHISAWIQQYHTHRVHKSRN